MGSLKDDHTALYKRVKLKAIVFAALGIMLTFAPEQVGATQRNSAILTEVPFWIFGGSYMLISLLITIGIFRSRSTYSFARKAMTIGATYNTLWTILLIWLMAIEPGRGTGWGLVMYTYFTYNTWLVRNDPGWGAIKKIKQVKRAVENAERS